MPHRFGKLHEAVIDSTTSRWNELTSPPELKRFSEIMRSMDDRYSGLSPTQLDEWKERKARAGRTPLILGLFDAHNRMTQVVAFTIRAAEDGRAEQRALAMTGVAADELDESQIDQAAIMRWTGHIVRAAKQSFGCPADLSTMRPKTMTWQPMQCLHDVLHQGIIVRDAANPTAGCLARVLEENDRGHSVFWRIRLEALPQPDRGELP